MSEKKIYFSVEGMTCTACSARIEKKLNRIEGIEARVNFATEKAVVSISDETKIQASEIIQLIENTGYKAREYLEDRTDEKTKSREKLETYLFIFSVILTLPLVFPMLLMVFNFHYHIPSYVQLLLATPVQFIVGYRFYKGAYSALRGFSANMDVLVALGTSTAYFLSLYTLLIHPGQHLYFEASASIITLVYLGKILEHGARKKTSSAIKELIELQPETALVRRDEEWKETSIREIQSGEVCQVRAGELIPVDGEVLKGESALEEASLTGESLPRSVRPGEKVYAGTKNLNASLEVKTISMGKDTALAKIIQTVETAIESRAPIQKLADKVSAFFVPTVVFISFCTFLVWWLITGNLELSIINAVAVLVISCPCALGLATPTAIVAGSGLGAKLGILIKDAATLEKMNRVDILAFDKTGTLTSGKTLIQSYELSSVEEESEFFTALCLENESNHPLAYAVRSFLKNRQISPPEIENLTTEAGKGIRGSIKGVDYYIGSAGFLKENGISVPTSIEATAFVGKKGRYLGCFQVSDELRPDAKKALEILRKLGIETLMLTGDKKEKAVLLAQELGIETFKAEVLPHEKREAILRLKKEGKVPGMIGDGINDGPALAEASLSFSLASGSGIAIETSDVSLLKNELLSVPRALLLSRAVIRKIKQNLFFAFIYNVIGIPLAALGFLNPMFAGAAMAMSSVSVVSNSLLLKRWKPGF